MADSSSQKSIEEFEKGDIIEFPRKHYSHVGVYVGDGKVIHKVPENIPTSASPQSVPIKACSKAITISAPGRIREDKLSDVAGCSTPIKRNEKDKWIKPNPSDEIVRKAKESIGAAPYHLLTQNCESFANDCRYGMSVSDQVEGVRTGIQVAAYVAGFSNKLPEVLFLKRPLQDSIAGGPNQMPD